MWGKTLKSLYLRVLFFVIKGLVIYKILSIISSDFYLESKIKGIQNFLSNMDYEKSSFLEDEELDDEPHSEDEEEDEEVDEDDDIPDYDNDDF